MDKKMKKTDAFSTRILPASKNCVSKDATMKRMEKGCCADLRSISEKTVLSGIYKELYNSILFFFLFS